MTEKYESNNNRDEVKLETERYATFSDGADGTIVYDRQNDNAWIQSEAAVEIAEMA